MDTHADVAGLAGYATSRRPRLGARGGRNATAQARARAQPWHWTWQCRMRHTRPRSVHRSVDINEGELNRGGQNMRDIELCEKGMHHVGSATSALSSSLSEIHSLYSIARKPRWSSIDGGGVDGVASATRTRTIFRVRIKWCSVSLMRNLFMKCYKKIFNKNPVGVEFKIYSKAQ